MFKVTPVDFPVRYNGVTYFVGDVFEMHEDEVDYRIVNVIEIPEDDKPKRGRKPKEEGE